MFNLMKPYKIVSSPFIQEKMKHREFKNVSNSEGRIGFEPRQSTPV